MSQEPQKLERVHRGRVPLPEVSGLSTSYEGDSARLVAVGDDRVSLAVTTVTTGGVVGEWTVITASDVNAVNVGGAFRQLEAAELDGAGRVWVLTEENSRLAGVDIEARQVIGAARLDTSTIPELHASWSRDDASRGEGLLLLRRGHVLVAKEKDPAVWWSSDQRDRVRRGCRSTRCWDRAKHSASPRTVCSWPSRGGSWRGGQRRRCMT